MSDSSRAVLRTLNRPQYVPTPETLISALAWEVIEYTDPELNPIGWRYLGAEQRSKNPPILESKSAVLERLGPALTSSGFQHSLDETLVAHAVANGIVGVKPTRSKGRAASPLTPSLALLQNSVGMTGAPNPANYASILEALFCLGATRDSPGVANLWLGAAEARVSMDPVLGVLDDAFASVRAPYQRREETQRVLTSEGWSNTPFGWFYDAWTRLTTAEWVAALPPRVWTDWATTVLRLALAMGYLWEFERYRRICRAAIAGESTPTSAGMPTTDEPFELVPWTAGHLPVSTRNVRAIIRRKTFDGGRLRAVLVDWEDRHPGVDPDAWLSGDAFRIDAQASLNAQDTPRFLQNLYETVVYSLQRRDLSDHYGLLVARGPSIAIVSPGTEWIAVVASLAAGSPGHETHVGEVVRDLGRLGLQPRLPDLIRLLESAGLARGSADADHGVRVTSAF